MIHDFMLHVDHFFAKVCKASSARNARVLEQSDSASKHIHLLVVGRAEKVHWETLIESVCRLFVVKLALFGM